MWYLFGKRGLKIIKGHKDINENAKEQSYASKQTERDASGSWEFRKMLLAYKGKSYLPKAGRRADVSGFVSCMPAVLHRSLGSSQRLIKNTNHLLSTEEKYHKRTYCLSDPTIRIFSTTKHLPCRTSKWVIWIHGTLASRRQRRKATFPK